MLNCKNMPGRARLLYIHASADKLLRDELEKHLAALAKPGGLIEGWHMGLLPPGGQVDQELAAAVAQAQLVLLLLSSDAVASELCQDLLAKAQASAVPVVPVLVRPVVWRGFGLDEGRVLPPNGEAVTTWGNQDLAWVAVVEGLQAQLLGVRVTPQRGALGHGQPVMPSLPPVPSMAERRLRPVQHALFIVLVWEKMKAIWSHLISVLSNTLHLSPVVVNALMFGGVIATSAALTKYSAQGKDDTGGSVRPHQEADMEVSKAAVTAVERHPTQGPELPAPAHVAQKESSNPAVIIRSVNGGSQRSGLGAHSPMQNDAGLKLPAQLQGKAVVVAAGDLDYPRADVAAAIKSAGASGIAQALVVRLTEDVPVWRMWSGPAKKDARGNTNRLGQWWTYDSPHGDQQQYRQDYEICRAWNDLTWMARCTLKKGAVVAIGPGQSVTAKECGDPTGEESYPANERKWQVWLSKAWARTGAAKELDCPVESEDYMVDVADISRSTVFNNK